MSLHSVVLLKCFGRGVVAHNDARTLASTLQLQVVAIGASVVTGALSPGRGLGAEAAAGTQERGEGVANGTEERHVDLDDAAERWHAAHDYDARLFHAGPEDLEADVVHGVLAAVFALPVDVVDLEY